MIDYKILPIKNINNFTNNSWNEMLKGFYSSGMEQYVPYWSGDTYNSEKYFVGIDLMIYYDTDYSNDIYNGIYFGVARNPSKKFHSKASNKWADVYTNDNQIELERLWELYIGRFE